MDSSLPDKNTTQPTVLGYVYSLLENWKFISYSSLLVALCSVIVSLLLPEWYKAEGVILATQEEFSLFPTPNMSKFSLSQFSIVPGGENLQRYVAILKSRSVMDRVINNFDLVHVYNIENNEEARKELEGNFDVAVEEEGTVRITVWDKSPERVSQMANYFLFVLDSTNKNLNTHETRFKRIAIENRYNQNIAELKQSEESLKTFQEKNNIVSLPEQTEVTIQATAELIGQLNLLELDLGIKEKILGSSHPDIKKITSQIREYQKRIRELMQQQEMVSSASSGNEGEKIFIPFKKFPGLTMEYIRLRRNLEAQNKIFELLTEQLELARLMETKDTPTLQVLDHAIPPLKKALPKRMLIVLMATMSSLLLSCVFVFAGEHLKKNYRKTLR